MKSGADRWGGMKISSGNVKIRRPYLILCIHKIPPRSFIVILSPVFLPLYFHVCTGLNQGI